jgi:RHS repeat-associated protein
MKPIARLIQWPAIVRPLRGILCVLTLLLAGAATARAQSDYASIPPALAPGSPAGSYRLSDIDTVNLFNGSVNVHLPLTGISGRGGAKSMAALNWDAPARWQIVKGYDAYGGAVYGPQVDPMSDSTGRLRLGNWGAYFKKSVDVVLPCGPNNEGIFYAQYTLVRLHVVEPNGTDHELRDTATGGQPLTNPGCTYQGQSRGREFVSADGSGITVLFDDVIRDVVQMDQGDVTGGGGGVWLLLPDGRKLRSTPNSLTMRDRNGNTITWEDHMGGALAGDLPILPGIFSAVKDSLDRRVTPGNAPVSECVSRGGDAQGICSYVSYQGFGGVERRIYIGTNAAYLTTGVFLPGGLSYRFYYNQYDDLTRIDLPTGGSVEYEFGPGLDGPQPAPDYRITNPLPGIYNGGPSDFHVYRRVTERRLYKEGHVLVNRQTFSKPEHTQNGNAGFVEKKNYDTNGTTLLSSEKHYYYGGANDTFNVWQPFAYTAWKIGREYRTEFYDESGGLLRVVEHSWQQRAPVSWWTGNPDDAPSNDPRVYQTVTTLENGLSSRTLYGFDPTVPYNSQTDLYEYDYVAPGGTEVLLRLTHTDYEKSAAYIDAPPTGAYLRNLPKVQWVSTDGWGNNPVSRTDFGYDEFALLNRLGITGHDASYSTAWTVRGNQTSVTRYADAVGPSGPITTTAHYDIAGNVINATDNKGNTTEISYADSFCNDNGVRCAGTFTPNTYAFPTGTTSPVPDSATELNSELGTNYSAGAFGSTSALTASTVFDFYTGLVYSTTDANNQTTQMEYADPLDRPTAQVRPGQTGGRTDISYAADGRSVRVLSDLDSSRRLDSYQYFDGLGRPVRSQTYENVDPAKPWLTTDTEYDAMGRAKRTSFPYRWTAGTSSPFSTNRWSETGYDDLSRVRSVKTQPYGATVSTDYSGDRVLVKDQAGRERVSRSDALGRVTEVWEVTPQESGAEASTVALASFPGHPEAAHGYLTKYRYDALGNLRMVEQEGKHLGQMVTQRRFFAYDSLSRLLRVKNPEQGALTADADFPALTDATSGVSNNQWSVGYAYDANGNVSKRKDARNVVTSYRYDHLNRLVRTGYANDPAQTPAAYRHYDGSINGRGRFWYSDKGVSATGVDAYDEVGRVREQHQNFLTGTNWSAPYSVQLTYNKAGLVTSQIYPSGHTVTYNYDAAGRPADYNGQAAVAGDLGDGVPRTYASEVRYHELGGREQERFGTQTPVYNKSLFNSRGQLAEVRVSTHSLLSPGQETNWNRGAIINHYSTSGWGASGGGADNNGNLLRQEVYVPDNDQVSGYANVVQEYGYDALNRLNAVYDKPFNGAADFYQLYKYDRWGNRTIDPASWQAPAPQFSVDAATNRLGVPAGQAGAMNYDAAGNLVNDGYTGYGDPTGQQQTRFYDPEGRMTSARSSASQTAAYTYDADGHRVRRDTGSAQVWQVYGAGGELLAEYAAGAAPAQPQKEYGYRGGGLLVTAEAGDSVWVDDSLPAGASAFGDGEGWNWVTSGPSPHSGSVSHQSNVVGGMHQHYFAGATSKLAVAAGEKLYAYVYLDPSNPPTEVMLQWNSDTEGWNHRAYWGADQIGWGTNGTGSRRYMGALPAAGGWVRLEVPASLVGLEGKTVNGMAFTLYGGRATWDKGGKTAGGTGAGVRWLVGDQLGTPRMVIDQTGSLAGVKRHDYLPFGEAVAADMNWRTTGRGYATDTVRQQFTGYERDSETGLDYAQARYFATGQGRFTGVDPLLASARAGSPQSWNRYAYVINNPLRLIDPSGMNYFVGGSGAADPFITEYRFDGFEMSPDGSASNLDTEDMAGIYAQWDDVASGAATYGTGGDAPQGEQQPLASASIQGVCSIELMVSGTTSPGNNLTFISGSQQLGPMEASYGWVYQLEIRGTVKGDASKWFFGRRVSEKVAAETLDLNLGDTFRGSLSARDKPDPPLSYNIQKSAGQSSFFVIDTPGVRKISGFSRIAVAQVQNFYAYIERGNQRCGIKYSVITGVRNDRAVFQAVTSGHLPLK